MADNALAKQVGKKLPQRRKTRLEQLADEIEAYGGRVRDDFLAGAERSAQGLGDIVERGDVLTGIPRLALGGTAWMGAPVSAALSPVLGPILQPVGEAVNTYVGQPVEDLTGYPADITNDLAMTGLTLGAAKGLGMTRPYLARAADQVEGMANRAGYTLRKPANVYGSGPVLTRLQDPATIQYGDVSDIPNRAQRQALHEAYMQRALREDLPATFYHGSPDDIYSKGGFRLNYGEDNVPAVWATSSPLSAEDYARGKMSSQYDEAAGRFPIVQSNYAETNALQGGVYGLTPKFQNPLVIDAEGGPIRNKMMVMRQAKEAGHDAIVFRNAQDNLLPGGVPSDVVAFLTPDSFQPNRQPANVYGSGPTLTPLVDEADNVSKIARSQSVTKNLTDLPDLKAARAAHLRAEEVAQEMGFKPGDKSTAYTGSTYQDLIFRVGKDGRVLGPDESMHAGARYATVRIRSADHPEPPSRINNGFGADFSFEPRGKFDEQAFRDFLQRKIDKVTKK